MLLKMDLQHLDQSVDDFCSCYLELINFVTFEKKMMTVRTGLMH